MQSSHNFHFQDPKRPLSIDIERVNGTMRDDYYTVRIGDNRESPKSQSSAVLYISPEELEYLAVQVMENVFSIPVLSPEQQKAQDAMIAFFGCADSVHFADVVVAMSACLMPVSEELNLVNQENPFGTPEALEALGQMDGVTVVGLDPATMHETIQEAVGESVYDRERRERSSVGEQPSVEAESAPEIDPEPATVSEWSQTDLPCANCGQRRPVAMRGRMVGHCADCIGSHEPGYDTTGRIAMGPHGDDADLIPKWEK